MGLGARRSGNTERVPADTDIADLLLLNDELRQLVEAAEERGSLRRSELNETLEPLSLDALELEALDRELETRGIDLVDDVHEDDDAPPEPPPVAPPPSVSWETTTDALQLFLREAGRHPLLTAAQEVELAKKIERGDALAKQ